MNTYEVFVQWKRGKSHKHQESISAPDPKTALMFAKRNVDVRGGPVDIWVAPRKAIYGSDDIRALVPSTDREYRSVTGYSANPTATTE